MLLISHKNNKNRAQRCQKPLPHMPEALKKKRNITDLRDYTIRRYLSLSESSIWSSHRQTTLPRLWWISWVPALGGRRSADKDSYNVYVAPGACRLFFILLSFISLLLLTECVLLIDKHARCGSLSFLLSVSLLLCCAYALWRPLKC